MSEVIRKVRIDPGEGVTDPYVHFSGVGSSQVTLCGWFDCATEDAGRKAVDCPRCWAVVEYCKAIGERRKVAPANSKR
jgi:hypothetical protein